MASLANQTISSTYDGLIKTSSDNAVPVSGVQALEDGSGNALALSVGRSGNGVTVSGNLAVDTNTLYVDAASDGVGFGTTNLTVGIGNTDTGASVRSVGAIQASRSGNRSLYLNRNTTDGQIISINRDGSEVGAIGAAGNGLAFYTGITERMRIDSSGKTTFTKSAGAGIVASFYDGTYGVDLASTSSGASIQTFNTNQTLNFNTYGTGYVTFTSGSSESMRIDSSGNVGIGLTPTNISGHTRLSVNGSTVSRLDLYSGGTERASLYSTSSSSALQVNGSVPFVFSVGGGERMRIDSSGNVGIGTQNPVADSLTLYKTTFPYLYVQNSNSGTAASDGLRIGLESSTEARIDLLENLPLVFRTNATERMRITSSGDVLIGTQSIVNSSIFSIDSGTTKNGVGIELDAVSGFTCASLNRTAGDGTFIAFLRGATSVGSITVSGSSTSYNTSSDYRLKENVVEMTGALDRVDALKPSRFNFIADPEKTVDGFLAHEVQAIVPEAVTGEKDAVDEEGNPIYQGIDQSKIVPLLVGAIKELSAKVAALESQLNA